jgi:predicted Ser/Thr protein kinase
MYPEEENNISVESPPFYGVYAERRFCYASFMERSRIENMFADAEKISRGSNRRVWEIKEEGVDFIVKEKFSRKEVEILRFLQDLRVGENLLAYDADNLLIEKTNGEHIDEYVRRVVDNHERKVSHLESAAPVPGSRLKFTGFEITTLEGNVLETDGEIRKFVVDYISKLLFLILNGIMHNDITSGNILVDPVDSSARFIDFDRAVVFGNGEDFGMSFTSEFRNDYIAADSEKTIALIQTLGDDVRSFRDSLRDKNHLLSSFIEDVYEKSGILEAPLLNRPVLLEKALNIKKLEILLSELGLSLGISADVASALTSLIKKAVR